MNRFRHGVWYEPDIFDRGTSQDEIVFARHEIIEPAIHDASQAMTGHPQKRDLAANGPGVEREAERRCQAAVSARLRDGEPTNATVGEFHQVNCDTLVDHDATVTAGSFQSLEMPRRPKLHFVRQKKATDESARRDGSAERRLHLRKPTR
jgi:hypothetical protein